MITANNNQTNRRPVNPHLHTNKSNTLTRKGVASVAEGRLIVSSALLKRMLRFLSAIGIRDPHIEVQLSKVDIEKVGSVRLTHDQLFTIIDRSIDHVDRYATSGRMPNFTPRKHMPYEGMGDKEYVDHILSTTVLRLIESIPADTRPLVFSAWPKEALSVILDPQFVAVTSH